MTLELAKPRPIWQIMFSTHHTDVGLLYLITSLAFLFMGGSLALIIRLELFLPGSQFIADSMTFNRIFTVHGTTLIFLFILPFASAVGNYFVPIMIRYKDMAYPKLNAIAFWMIPPAGALIWLGFADFTWYANHTHNQRTRSCSRHVDIRTMPNTGHMSILGAIKMYRTSFMVIYLEFQQLLQPN